MKRIVNRKLLDSYHFLPCLNCGERQGVVAHHIKTKKSGGHDIPQNLMPLCFLCHFEVHSIGMTSFASQNAYIEHFLIEMGWEYSEFYNKWFNSEVS